MILEKNAITPKPNYVPILRDLDNISKIPKSVQYVAKSLNGQRHLAYSPISCLKEMKKQKVQGNLIEYHKDIEEKNKKTFVINIDQNINNDNVEEYIEKIFKKFQRLPPLVYC